MLKDDDSKEAKAQIVFQVEHKRTSLGYKGVK